MLPTALERQVAPPVATPALALRPLRDLTLQPREDGRPPHLAAASALVATGASLIAVADDELHIALFDAAAGATAPGTLHRVFPGRLPDDPDQRKAAKPDLEAATRIPAGPGQPHDALLAFGSGSKKLLRNRGFAWSLDASGALTGTPRALDLAPLYAGLKPHIQGKLNIEGAAVRANELLLFQRGNSKGGVSAVLRLNLDAVRADLAKGSTIGPSSYLGQTTYDLGAIKGAKLHFTDATSLPNGEVAFLAAAEVTDDPVNDGRILGSAIGVLDAKGAVRQLHLLDAGEIKTEGIAWVGTTGGMHDLRVVTDADDPARASRMYAVQVPVAPPA